MSYVRVRTDPAIICAVLMLAFACLVPRAASANVYPPGIVARASSGIYPALNADACCWMSNRARVSIVVPAGADALLVTVFIPSYAVVNGKAQSFFARIDGEKAQNHCCYGPGQSVVALSVPVLHRDRTVVLSLVPSYTFVPMQRGINGDRRHLSALLRSVAAVKSADAAMRPGPQWSPAMRVRIGIAFAFAFVFVLGLTIRRPAYAAAALVLSDPFAFSIGVAHTTVTLPKVVLVAGLLGLALRARRQRMPGRAAGLIGGALLLFAASMALSSLSAADRGAAVRETLKTIEYVACFAFAYMAFRIDRDEAAIRIAVVAVSLAVSLLALAQVIFGAPESATMFGRDVARISGPMEGPNQLAGFLGIVLPMVTAWMVTGRRTLALWFALAIGLAALVLTFSRGGEAALAVAVVTIVLLARWPAHARAIAATIGAAWSLLFAFACAQFAGLLHWNWLFGRAADESGLGTRTELWDAADRLWRTSPWIGIGPANFPLEVSRYYPGLATHANSIYFNTLAEQGVVGATTLAALMAATILAFANRFRTPIALGALGIVVAMAFHQVVDTMWFYPKVGTIFWSLLGVAAAAIDSDDSDAMRDSFSATP